MGNELKVKEYEMLRQEILQYLEKYQVVRNMMYVITVTLLGFCLTGKTTNICAYLLPLIVILPSHIISYDYWSCVTKASTYLRVFHERNKESVFHWETRHCNFNKIHKMKPKSEFQGLPYFLCYLTCIILYFFNINYCKENLTYIIIGKIAEFIGIFVFVRYYKIDDKEYIASWEKIQEAEIKESKNE